MLQLVDVETIEMAARGLSQKWPIAIVMTVGGNLRHRIAILGDELEEVVLTEKQRALRTIACAQGFEELFSVQR